MLCEVFSFRIVGNVEKLISVVVRIRYAMGMIAILPNLSGEVIANGEGKASLY
jgi:hypothetical protein